MLIQADASGLQLEWRVLVELAKDSTGLNEILNKEDVHVNNQITFKLPDRLIAKKYLFRTIYNRGKGYAFTVDPDFMHVSTSIKYWDNIGEQFYSKYYGINKKHLEWGADVVEGLPIVGPFGRFWPIDMTINYKGEVAIPWSVLTNLPVQGTGHDIVSIARVSFFSRLKKTGLYDKGVKLISTVHDSIVADIPDTLAQPVCNLFHQVFDDIPLNIMKMFNYDWQVPLGCEVKYGANLKTMTKLDRTA